MRKFLAAAAALALSAGANASVVAETEGNNAAASANNIDAAFSLDYSANIGDMAGNTSQTIAHATVNAFAEQGGRDVFSFTVSAPGRGIFDIDYAYYVSPGYSAQYGFDANLVLLDANGSQLAYNDDNSSTYGAGGTDVANPGDGSLDSYLEYVFTIPGTYYIEVSSCCARQPFNQYNFQGFAGAEFDYQLQVSIQNHSASGAVPEPASLALLGLGLGALAFRRRKV